MPSNDIGDWYRGIPQISKYWFTGSVIIPLAARFNFLDFNNQILLFEPVIYKLQIWRLVTSVLYYRITPSAGFKYLVNLYLLYSYSTRLETGIFDGRPAEYVFMLLFNWLCLVVLMEQMILSVLYVWCQINRDEIIEFWLGTRFKAMCLPWIYVAFDIIVDHRSPVIALSGVIVGHVYFFLMFKYPLDFGGVRLLYAPRILYKNFPNRREKMAWFGQAPASLRRSSDDQDEHRWGGRGHILGGN